MKRENNTKQVPIVLSKLCNKAYELHCNSLVNILSNITGRYYRKVKFYVPKYILIMS